MILPKAPSVSLAERGIADYRSRLKDYELSLRNKLARSFYRKDLKTRARSYSTLADQRATDSAAEIHFRALANLHNDILEDFGEEPPPKSRIKRLESVPINYPKLPDGCIYRAHFFAGGSLLRERSAALSNYADALSSQTAPDGSEILSVGVASERVQFFERLVESIGQDGLHLRPNKNGGFYGFAKSDGSWTKEQGWEDLSSPWRRIRDDNCKAQLYHWSAWRGGLDPSIKLPSDCPDVPGSLPWDPDPRFNEILQLTQADRLDEALNMVGAIPPDEREVLYDEVIYLKGYIRIPQGGKLRGTLIL